jgi:cyclophilin family peptidyl-prolyl cis-trans isomerase
MANAGKNTNGSQFFMWVPLLFFCPLHLPWRWTARTRL